MAKIQNAIANQQQGNMPSLKDYVVSMKSGIAAALPSVMTPERFTRMALSAISSNPKLQECSPQSFLGSMMTAAQLGLEPNTPLGQAYLLPYYNRGRMECQFQLGYRGLIDLAYRSGEVKLIQAHTVHENDVFEYELGLEPKLRHVPATKDRGEAIAYYAMFQTKDGGYGFQVMSLDDIKKHAARYSQSYNSSYSPWKTNFDEMAKKTVLKKVLKYAPLRSDFVKGMASDETIKSELSPDMVDLPNEQEYNEVPESDPTTGEVVEDAGQQSML